MSTELIMLFVLIVVIVAALPAWPHSQSWGFVPTAIFTVVLVVFLVWMFGGKQQLFSNESRRDAKTALENAGQDLKAAGRDVSETIRRTVQ